MPRQSRRKKKTTSLSSRMRKPAVAQRPPTVDEAMQGDFGPGVSLSAVAPSTRKAIGQMQRAGSALDALRTTNRRAAQGQFPSAESVADIPTPEPNAGIQSLTGRLTRRRDQARSRLADLESSIGSLRDRLASPMSPADMRRAQAQRDPFTASVPGTQPSALTPIRGGVPIEDPIPGMDLTGRELTNQPGVFATEEGFVETIGEPSGRVRRDKSGTYVSNAEGTLQGRLTPEGRYLPTTREGLARQDAQRNRAARAETPLAESDDFQSLRRALEDPNRLGGAVDTEGMTVADAMQARREGQEQMGRQSRLERMLRTPQGRQELAERAQAQGSLNQQTGGANGGAQRSAPLELAESTQIPQETIENVAQAYMSGQHSPDQAIALLQDNGVTLPELEEYLRFGIGDLASMGVRASTPLGWGYALFEEASGANEAHRRKEAALQDILDKWRKQAGQSGPPNSGSSRSRRRPPNSGSRRRLPGGDQPGGMGGMPANALQ